MKKHQNKSIIIILLLLAVLFIYAKACSGIDNLLVIEKSLVSDSLVKLGEPFDVIHIFKNSSKFRKHININDNPIHVSSHHLKLYGTETISVGDTKPVKRITFNAKEVSIGPNDSLIFANQFVFKMTTKSEIELIRLEDTTIISTIYVTNEMIRLKQFEFNVMAFFMVGDAKYDFYDIGSLLFTTEHQQRCDLSDSVSKMIPYYSTWQ